MKCAECGKFIKEDTNGGLKYCQGHSLFDIVEEYPKIKRRTFAAKNYPKESTLREKLNEDVVTSEYMPSYRYIVLLANRSYRNFRTKKEAEKWQEQLGK